MPITDRSGLAVVLLAEGRIADWVIVVIAVCAGLVAAAWLWRDHSRT